MFFSLCREREGTKRELVARFVPEGISTLRTELRDSLRSNRSSLLLRSRSQSLHSLASTFAIATIFHQRGGMVVKPPPTPPERGRGLWQYVIIRSACCFYRYCSTFCRKDTIIFGRGKGFLLIL